MDGAGGRFAQATLDALEFPLVIGRIAALATCAPGVSAVRALAPLDVRAAAEAELALVSDAQAALQAGADLGFGGAEDTGDSLDRSDVGGTLAGAELAAIARSERALSAGIASLRSPAGESKPAAWTRLLAVCAGRRDTVTLTRELDHAIAEDGAVLDSASSELARLRRQQRAAAEEVRRKLDEIVRNSVTAKLLSEPIVTVRRGRFVVPVRIEMAGQLNGVVHDQSASGATVYVEPMACVEANNRLRALEAAEEREIQRILTALSALVGSSSADLRANAALLARLDSIGARARFAAQTSATSPALDPEPTLRIVHGRHPLLRKSPVPLDVDLGEAFDALIISGPNMGGKTVVLKTVGLFCLLAYAGVPVPAAAGTRIGWFGHIACVIGDEQSIADDLSSFSAHLRALHEALRHARPGSLVLVDEIGNGTEPGAGAALAQAFIETLLAAGARVIVTTHYTQLKIFAASRDRVANASMAFDLATREPTYALAIGVPGQSLAFELATSLGLDRTMIARAESLFGEDAQNLERAFAGLAAERERFARQAGEAEAELARMRGVETSLRAEIEAASAARRDFERTAHDALERGIAAARDELIAKAERADRDARRQRVRIAGDTGDAVKTAMADIRRSLGLEAGQSEAAAPSAYAAGDRVYVKRFGQPGIVSEIYDRDALVTMGAVRAVVPLSDITRDPAALGGAAATRAASAADRGASSKLASLEAATSVDVRGMRVDEASEIVDKALDEASLAGLTILRIIHGKGTGQLGRGLREFLRGHPQVQTTATPSDREGGTGVTVVTLR